ncbi:MAG: UDP-3-O-(3-hydroxymyristoyl)glucosamine N-acyltransferase [Pseudomonadota bacterium]
MPVAVAEIARRLGATAEWLNELPDGTPLTIEHIALPSNANRQSLSFLTEPANADQANKACAVLTLQAHASLLDRPLVVAALPLSIARAHQWLPLADTASGGIRRTNIHPSAVIDQSVSIGEHSSVGANTVLCGDVRIGNFCDIEPNATIIGPVALGNRVRIGANSVIGGQSFTYVEDGEKWIKFPDLAAIKIHDGAEIGAGVTIDRGTLSATVIGTGVILDNQVHVGHGVSIGRDCAIAAKTVIAGEASIGEGCKIGGACAIGEGVQITNDVTLLGMTGVSKSLHESGEYASGWPAQPRRQWWRQLAKLKSLAKHK